MPRVNLKRGGRKEEEEKNEEDERKEEKQAAMIPSSLFPPHRVLQQSYIASEFISMNLHFKRE